MGPGMFYRKETSVLISHEVDNVNSSARRLRNPSFGPFQSCCNPQETSPGDLDIPLGLRVRW